MKTRVSRAAMAILLASFFGPGCAKKQEPVKESPPPFQRDEQSLAGMVKQERTKIQNDFTNLALYYRMCSDGNRGPAKWQELKAFIGNEMPSLTKGVEEGRYVVVYKAGLGSNDLIAYENQGDVRGQHVALFGDGHIVTISTEELAQAKKGKN